MPKSKEQQLEDGWTRVSGKKSATTTNHRGLPQLDKNLTVEGLISDYSKKMNIWQRSSSRGELHKILDREHSFKGWTFKKAICLGSGSFSRDNWECCKRSMFQFVSFVDMVQYLTTKSDTPIKMLAQDPNYTEIDKVFLRHLGFDVLEVSSSSLGLLPAKDHLGKQTVVFELFLDMTSDKMQDLFTPDMQLYIGSGLQSFMLKGEPKVNATSALRKQDYDDKSILNSIKGDRLPVSNLARDFLKQRRALRFPKFEEDPLIFEGLMLYSKEPEDDENDVGE